MQEKIVVDLINPIKSHLNIDGRNDIVEITKLYLVAPTPYKHKYYTIDLKKRFVSAMVRLANSTPRNNKNEKEQEDKNIDAKAFIQILYSSGDDFDLVGFFKKFSDLLCNNICFKDESTTQKIIQLDLDKLSEEDFDNITGKYFEAFLSASLMKILK
jgi:hypothetical protein